MAVLEDIRKKGGIIVSGVIFVALLAFVIGDFLPGRGNRNLDIAKVGGETLTLQHYEIKVEEMSNMYRQNMQQNNLDEQMMDMIREQSWTMLINETVMKQEYGHIELIVSPEELFDIIQGPNPSPRIRDNFTDPQTGEFNRSALVNFLKNKESDPNASREWSMLEKSLLDERYMQKYNSLVGKGIFVPDFMADNENLEINKKVDFDYVTQKYTSIPDSTIKVTDDDLRKYYEKHKKQWEQTTSRDIEYVSFPLTPSSEDRVAADAWMEKIKPEFEQAADPMQFVRLNSKVPADTRFMTREQLPVQAAELFDSPVGSMVGPYQESEALKLVRSAKIEDRPDSVKVRQIVLMPKEQTQQAYQQTVALSDSIKTAIETGADFATLAVKYSADPSVATTQGELGWIQEAAMQSGSMMETIFNMKKGEVTKMESQQGIFVVQVTERGKEIKKVQIATLQYNIVASSKTEQFTYSQASKFAVENRSDVQFDAAVTDQKLNKRVATYLGENDSQIPGLSSARQVVRWAYQAKIGDVSDVFTVDNSYVIAVLKNIRKKGIAPINQVVTEIDLAVRREKKAEQIAAKLSEAAKNAQSFSDLAVSLNLPVETVSATTFSAFSIPGVGIEPQLIASAATMSEGNISQPIEGVNGVYLLTVKQVVEPEEEAKAQAKERLATTYVNRSMSESVQALRKAADVKDMRSKFY